MTRKEEERVEAERQRMRRLMSEGHISAREFREGKLFQSTSKQARKPRKTSRPSSQPHSHRKQKTAKVVFRFCQIELSLWKSSNQLLNFVQRKKPPKFTIYHAINRKSC